MTRIKRMFENIRYQFILLMMKYLMRLDRLCILKNHVTRGNLQLPLYLKIMIFRLNFVSIFSGLRERYRHTFDHHI